MKKIIILLAVIVLIFFGCKKDNINRGEFLAEQTSEYINTEQNVQTGERTAAKKTYESIKEGVTVKKHNIPRLINGYSYWYVNTNAEKILNIINRRDREELRNLISKSSQSESDIEKQMDILFEYIDGDFIDYEEGLPGEDNYVSYGETLRQSFSVVVLAETEKTEYNVCINSVLKDNKNEDNMGITFIDVTKKEISDYFFTNYDSQSQPKFPDQGGIWCMEKGGVVW